MHWASPPRWGLALLAELDHGISGRALGAAAEQAVLYANPLLLAAFLIVAIPRVARRFGSAGAALLAVGTIACYPFYLNFIAGDAEHQGAAEVCALLTVVGLLGGAAGWVGPLQPDAEPDGLPSAPAARRWFLVSAAAGGLGLWLSTASEAPVLAATGLGAIASLAAGAPRPRPGGRNLPPGTVAPVGFRRLRPEPCGLCDRVFPGADGLAPRGEPPALRPGVAGRRRADLPARPPLGPRGRGIPPPQSSPRRRRRRAGRIAAGGPGRLPPPDLLGRRSVPVAPPHRFHRGVSQHALGSRPQRLELRRHRAPAAAPAQPAAAPVPLPARHGALLAGPAGPRGGARRIRIRPCRPAVALVGARLRPGAGHAAALL